MKKNQAKKRSFRLFFIIIGLIAVLIFVIVIWWLFLAKGSTAPTNYVIIPSTNINVSDQYIKLNGVITDETSYIRHYFCGYDAKYRNDSLYIQIRDTTTIGDLFESAVPPSCSKVWGSFNISISNTFGTIKNIYLQGYEKDDVELIWPNAASSSVAPTLSQPAINVE